MIAFLPVLWHDGGRKPKEEQYMEATLGKRIAAHRKQLGLTQDQLAEKLGLTAQAVSKWENDLSCPDIAILPKLADIFGTTTDTLLGRETKTPVCETEPIMPQKKTENGFEYDSDSGKMDFHWEGAKLDRICLACWVLVTGAVYLVSQLLHIDVSFWNILWPSFLLAFGIFGLYPKFSVFRLGCGLAGGYFLLDKLQILPFQADGGLILAAVILLFGLALLADAMRKKKRRKFGPVHLGNQGKLVNDYTITDDSFHYDASFGDCVQYVEIDKLRSGSISTNFGEYTVDLTGVRSVEKGCQLQADCSFGELTIVVPRQYTVIPDSSTSFASFDVLGHADAEPQGILRLQADVSFGSIIVQYQ